MIDTMIRVDVSKIWCLALTTHLLFKMNRAGTKLKRGCLFQRALISEQATASQKKPSIVQGSRSSKTPESVMRLHL